MDAENPFADVELAHEDKPYPRLPVVLLLDRSGSMSGEPIKELNEAFPVIEEVFGPETGDLRARNSVDIAVVSFGDDVRVHDLSVGGNGTLPADAARAFILAGQYRSPVLTAGGGTPLGAAMRLALNLLEDRKQIYKQKNQDYHRPLVFLISDGYPTDTGWEQSAEEAMAAIHAGKVSIWPIAVKGADMAKLGRFSDKPAAPLAGLKFRELFQWMSNSMRTQSHRATGQGGALSSADEVASWLQAPSTHG